MREYKTSEEVTMTVCAAKDKDMLRRVASVGRKMIGQGGRCRLVCSGIAISVGMMWLAGCGVSNNAVPQNGSQNGIPSPFPIPSVPTVTNTYTGTQSPGLWSYTIDNTQSVYSYEPITYPNPATTGSFVPLNGFMALSNSVGSQSGYGIEIPSRASLLRPGDDTTDLVAAVQQLSCFPLVGNVKFQFVSLPTLYSSLPSAYGSIIASTSPDGSSWQFGGQALYQLPTTYSVIGSHPGTQISGYPNTFAGTCSANNGQASINAPAINTSQYATPAATFVVGPTGFIIEDQSIATPPSLHVNATPSMFGVVQPSASLVTGNIVTGTYLGFMSTPFPVVHTQAIGFGQIVAGSGTTMTGGVWPNDDLTQLQNSDMVLNLGTQDPNNNGLYPSATLTVADPTYLCPTVLQSGLDANGFPTCTFEAVAVVGNPENKFAIFVATNVLSSPAAIYLFQQ